MSGFIKGAFCVNNDFEVSLLKESLKVKNMEIRVGFDTRFYDWFDKPVKFCGFIKDKNCAVFSHGSESSDLFSTRIRYSFLHIVDEQTIGVAESSTVFSFYELNDKNKWIKTK